MTRPTTITGIAPARIQLQRTKGWRLPTGAKSVARPSRWGNPFFVERTGNEVRWTGWYVGTETGHTLTMWGERPTKLEAQALAVELYELHIGPMGNYETDPAEIVRELGGRDLGCYCRVGDPCHGDVLLRLANPTT